MKGKFTQKLTRKHTNRTYFVAGKSISQIVETKMEAMSQETIILKTAALFLGFKGF